MPGDLAWWQTIGSGLLGGMATLGGQWLTGRQARKAQAEAREHDREVSAADRRNAFELGVLLDLREELATLVREAGDLREATVEAERAIGDGYAAAWEGAGSLAYDAACSAVQRTCPVVLDAEVRGTVARYLDDIGRFAAGEHAYGWTQFRERTDRLYKVVGLRVRELYGEPVGAEVSTKYHEPESEGS